MENITNLNIDLLIPNPNQPRKTFNQLSLEELATSIKTYGIINPILVRKKDDKYEIVAGERRYRAAKMAGLTEIPSIIKDISDQKMSEIAIIENIQRENITPIEEANSYKQILDNNSITEKELSELIGKSQPFISNKIRLLNLPNEIKEALINKQISEKHARSLLRVSEKESQINLLNKIITDKLSVKEVDEIINNQKEEKESDNMNNGNFFPNLNNQTNDNNASLNSMNMQTLNNGTINPTPQPAPLPTQPQVLPETPAIQNFNEPTIASTPEPTMMTQPQSVMPEQPLPTINVAPTETLNTNPTEPINPILNNVSTPEVTPEVNMNSPQPESPMIDIPLFNEQGFNSTNDMVEQSAVEPTIPNVVEPQNTSANVQSTNIETPLFNQEATVQQPAPTPTTTPENTNLNESFYEVPVNISPVIEENKPDKLSQVQQLLSSNGVEYKTYSNESGHCIIIEL